MIDALRIFLVLVLLVVFSCVHKNSESNILGVYKITDRVCNGSVLEIEACRAIVFVEFVKGSFYKIADNEVAFVVWSEEKGSDLLYQARKYQGEVKFDMRKLKLLIDDGEMREEVVFSSPTAGVYLIEKHPSLFNQIVKSVDFPDFTRHLKAS